MIPLCLLIVVAIVTGIYYFRKEKRRIEVQSVSELNWFGDQNTLTGSGNIISDGSQSVFLSKDNPIGQVYVQKGQQVSIGDPLLSYDMTKAKIQLEIKKLEVEKLQFEQAIAQKEWKELLEMKPLMQQDSVPQKDPESDAESETDDPVKTNPDSTKQDTQIDGYTKEELQKKQLEKKKQLQELDLKLRMSKLEVQSLTEAAANGMIKSQINGIVKSIQTEGSNNLETEPYILLTQSEGLYLYGTVSELQLENMKAGQMVSGNSWESGTSFLAVIKEIESFPVEGAGDMDNQAVSYYGFKAYIEDTTNLKVGEGVEYVLESEGRNDTELITLPKAYVREQDGQYYVLKEGKDHRIHKQIVEIGKVVYGTAYEIIDGITARDYIAFPYGKNAVLNTRVKRMK